MSTGSTMRRAALAGALAMLMLVPATSASANGCPSVEGTAFLNIFAPTGQTVAGTGLANLSYDGERIQVLFEVTGFVQIDETHVDVFFDWHFPDGTVSITEHSTTLPIGGPAAEFNSTLVVTSGGTGDWTWSGHVNFGRGIAAIQRISGDLCIP